MRTKQQYIERLSKMRRNLYVNGQKIDCTRNPDIPPEDAAQLWRYIGDGLCSSAAGVYLFGAYHGGSPIMEAIAITTQYDIESRKKMVKRLAGIPERE